MNAGNSIPEGKILIRFDGYCVLCSRTIRFILKADRKKKFLFQTLHDDLTCGSPETVIVTNQHSEYRYFDAVLKIGQELGGVFRAVALFRIIPRKWRHLLYLWVAKNRFRWFGKRNSCFLPSEEDRERFI